MEISPLIQTVVGITAGVCTSISMLPQLIKIIRERRAENISVGMLLLLLTGLGLWVFYGAVRKDLPLLVTNSFSFLLNTLLLIFSLVFKNRPGKKLNV